MFWFSFTIGLIFFVFVWSVGFLFFLPIHTLSRTNQRKSREKLNIEPMTKLKNTILSLFFRKDVINLQIYFGVKLHRLHNIGYIVYCIKIFSALQIKISIFYKL